ncbi:MAG: hypothetical protein ACTSXY_15150 [Promethearchaeota archaeon]
MTNDLVISNDNTIQKIKEIGMLTEDDFVALQKMSTELAENFTKAQVHRTKTEMEVSVLNDVKFPTPSSKYWQSVREMDVFYTELVRLSYDYRKNLIKLQMKEREIKQELDNLQQEILKIELEELQFTILQQEKVSKARIRELKDWSQIKKREAAQMTEEDLADVDNPQLIGYTKRWINQSLLMGANGSPAERQNLLGQLRSGIIACIQKGILNRVLEGFALQIQEQIKKEYGVKD